MIPLRQTVTITAAGTLDAWGRPTAGPQTSHKCRIDSSASVVRAANGQEVVAKAQILMRGAVQVGYQDSLSWTDAAGITYVEKPLAIAIITDLSGRPIFTRVMV